MLDDMLKCNLNRVKHKKDIFGNDIKLLSIKSRIGFLPISVWRPDWRLVSKLKHIIGDYGQTRPLDSERSLGLCDSRTAHKSMNARTGGNTYRRSLGGGERHKSTHGGGLGWMKHRGKHKSTKGGPWGLLQTKNKSTGGWYKNGGRFGYLSTDVNKDNISIFNPHLAWMILSAYCPPKARIYDPFAGGGTRGFVASAMGFNYYGREIRIEEVKRIRRQQKHLDLPFEICCQDAQLDLPVGKKFDFSYTCPPYYNMEVYSGLSSDLSNADSYPMFLQGIKRVLRSTYQCLKPGALAIWVVGNFRAGDELLHFSGDVIRKAKSVGFQLHDELIFWGAAGQASSRVGQFVKKRKAVRVHEYIIVLRKP